MPKASVIVATYRRDTPLEQALRSLGAQTEKDLEIVLVDDNADPQWNAAVAEVVARFREAFPEANLRVLVNESNLGSAKTRNRGVEEAAGTYVTFLDDDDRYLPGKVARQTAFMEAETLDYSVTDLFLYNERGACTDRRIRDYLSDVTPSALLEAHLMHHMTGTDTMMFRKDYFRKIGGFAPIDEGDEFYLMERAILGEGRFGYLPGCDVWAVVHTGETAGLSSGEQKIRGENALLEHKKQFFPRLSPAARRYILMRHHAVIAFAQLRRRHFLGFAVSAARSFFRSPVRCIRLLFRR